MAGSSLATVTIDSVGGLGDGIGRLDGKPVFVPKSCAGDTLSVRITQQTKEFMRGEIAGIVSAGAERTDALCPYFDACGGCSLQQLNATAYKAFKERVLADALAHGGFPGTPAAITFLPPATRRRVDFKIQHSGKMLALAYHGLRSHSLVPIDQCLILEPALQRLVSLLPSALAILPYASSFRALSLTLADNGVDMLLELSGAAPKAELAKLARALGIARISASNGKTTETVCEEPQLVMQLGGYAVPLPPDAFLQAAKQGQEVLTDFVLAHVESGARVADLFCGIGTYSFAISRKARVHGVEIQGAAVQNLKDTIDHYKLRGHMSAEARDLFQKPLTAAELEKFDTIVLNPPRAGAKAQAEAIAASKVKKLVMVSCNPASFARDAKILKAAGFTLTQAAGLDQFVWSPHLEIAAAFARG